MVVFDTGSALAIALAEAYRQCLPKAKFIDFNKTTPEAILKTFHSLAPSDLVVLIQSTSFRLEAFRIRVELFNRGLKVIEHPHLSSMKEDEIDTYLDSLAYDAEYFRRVGPALKRRMDQAKRAVVESGDHKLIFNGAFETAKLNVGDYAQMKNVGGQFPIGEVFSEAQDLESVSGALKIFAFGDSEFKVNKPSKAIFLTIEKGRVTKTAESTPEFEKVLSGIRADEGEIWVRELGFGLNRALTRERMVSDIGTYERMCGVHLSLGAKHALYKKPNFSRTQSKHHVDVFVATDSVSLDNELVYRAGQWLV